MPDFTDNYTTIRCWKAHQVVTVELNRPEKRNAINSLMRDELAQVMFKIKQDRDIKVLVLRGAGGAFCSGGDIHSMTDDTQAEQSRDRMQNLQRVIYDLFTLERPVIAAINGPAYGAGLGLALTADLIIASPTAKFCLSFLRLGAVPDCGTFYSLPRLVGLNTAKQLAFSTREFNSQEALDLGIISAIYKADLLYTQAEYMAQQLAKLPLSSLSITKRAFNASLDSDLNTMLEIEALGQGIARSTDFHQQAVKNFKEKKPPIFSNLLQTK